MGFLGTLFGKLAFWGGVVDGIGIRDTARIAWLRQRRSSDAIVLRRFGLALRPTESDLDVLKQVLIDKEYDAGPERTAAVNRLIAKLAATGEVPTIIDGGANVGYSAVYFAQAFPQATVIAVEPDPGAFAMLKRNCATYSNIVPVQGALWSHNRGVDLTNPTAWSWSRQVRDNGPTPSLTIEELLLRVPRGRLVIAKLDVEGAEAEIVGHSAETLGQCPCLLIEPHDWLLPGANTLSPALAVLTGRRIDTVIKGENLMFFDMDQLPPTGT